MHQEKVVSRRHFGASYDDVSGFLSTDVIQSIFSVTKQRPQLGILVSKAKTKQCYSLGFKILQLFYILSKRKKNIDIRGVHILVLNEYLGNMLICVTAKNQCKSSFVLLVASTEPNAEREWGEPRSEFEINQHSHEWWRSSIVTVRVKVEVNPCMEFTQY